MASLSNIKTRLIELQSFDDVETFSKLQEEIRNYIGQPGVTIGITPFYKVNGRYVFSYSQHITSVFLKDLKTTEEKEKFCLDLEKYFGDKNQPMIRDSVIVCPLKNYNNLIGTLEIVSETNNINSEEIINKIEPALPLFELALNRSCATLDARIDKIIKDEFTAIHRAVEWRFTEAALNYLVKNETDNNARMETILFEDVHPLYGAIDIKNSAEERAKAIEQDNFKDFDESITLLNKSIAGLVDNEQRNAQHIYPHYFERFVTDGVDFNVYAGQTITPAISFDNELLNELKLWQLTLMARAATLSATLSKQLPVPLETTQLILVYSEPISISFRPAERKFDVDGTYYTWYEILKKRIGKICIKNSEERLTQPGTLSIVYTHDKEAEEYKKYLQFLSSKGLFTGEPEYLELEELQGVNQLRALRQNINHNTE